MKKLDQRLNFRRNDFLYNVNAQRFVCNRYYFMFIFIWKYIAYIKYMGKNIISGDWWNFLQLCSHCSLVMSRDLEFLKWFYRALSIGEPYISHSKLTGYLSLKAMHGCIKFAFAKYISVRMGLNENTTASIIL